MTCFLPSRSVVGAISALSIVVIAAVFWDMTACACVHVRVCVLWNYFCEVEIDIEFLKKYPILLQPGLVAHKERLRSHFQ